MLKKKSERSGSLFLDLTLLSINGSQLLMSHGSRFLKCKETSMKKQDNLIWHSNKSPGFLLKNHAPLVWSIAGQCFQEELKSIFLRLTFSSSQLSWLLCNWWSTQNFLGKAWRNSFTLRYKWVTHPNVTPHSFYKYHSLPSIWHPLCRALEMGTERDSCSQGALDLLWGTNK